uniref:Uncharacterized protein n=1 Tax=Ditylenchus dipsaci TaxID=166011 RepID=A0A915EIW7_9BILA
MESLEPSSPLLCNSTGADPMLSGAALAISQHSPTLLLKAHHHQHLLEHVERSSPTTIHPFLQGWVNHTLRSSSGYSSLDMSSPPPEINMQQPHNSDYATLQPLQPLPSISTMGSAGSSSNSSVVSEGYVLRNGHAKGHSTTSSGSEEGGGSATSEFYGGSGDIVNYSANSASSSASVSLRHMPAPTTANMFFDEEEDDDLMEGGEVPEQTTNIVGTRDRAEFEANANEEYSTDAADGSSGYGLVNIKYEYDVGAMKCEQSSNNDSQMMADSRNAANEE